MLNIPFDWLVSTVFSAFDQICSQYIVYNSSSCLWFPVHRFFTQDVGSINVSHMYQQWYFQYAYLHTIPHQPFYDAGAMFHLFYKISIQKWVSTKECCFQLMTIQFHVLWWIWHNLVGSSSSGLGIPGHRGGFCKDIRRIEVPNMHQQWCCHHCSHQKCAHLMLHTNVFGQFIHPKCWHTNQSSIFFRPKEDVQG